MNSNQQSSKSSYFKRQLENSARGSNWLQKDINPALSFMILGIVLLSVFVMGAYFMKEYIKAWSIASEGADLVKRTECPKINIENDELLLP